MLFHSITGLLGIKDNHIEVVDSGEQEKAFWFQLETKVRKQTCPRCESRKQRMHAYRWQEIQGIPIAGKKVLLHLYKRRYRCVNCGKTFFEKLSFLERYQRQTTMLTQEVLSLTSEMSFTQAGKWMGVSTNRLIRMFDQREVPVNRTLPRAIAIDEFKGDAEKEKFQTIIVDVEERTIIDVLPNRRVETIENYFRRCDTGRVEIVVMDLSKSFKQAMQRQLGDPLIIADRFHFMRQAYWAFDDVRREVQQDLYKNQRIRLKRSKELLWKSPLKLDEKGKRRVEELLADHPQLREVYELKNALDTWFKTSVKEDAKEGLDAWFALVEQSKKRIFPEGCENLQTVEDRDFTILYVSIQ